MNTLTEKESRELKILEDPNVQYSTPATAFFMGWYYKRKRQKRLKKLKGKLSDETAIKATGIKKEKVRFIIIYYIVFFAVLYLLRFLIEYSILAEIYLISFIIGLVVPFFIKRNK